MSRCPMPTSAFLSLRTNTERTSMKFSGGNHYQQRMNWLRFGQNCTMDKGAGYDRKFKLTSNRCRHVANGFTNFTVGLHTACVVSRADESIIQRSVGGIIWPRAVFSSLVFCAKLTNHNLRNTHFYLATRMHSADYAVARCLSVYPSLRPSVCLSVTRRYSI